MFSYNNDDACEKSTGIIRRCRYFMVFLLILSVGGYSSLAFAYGEPLAGTYFENTRVIYSDEDRQGKSIVLNNNGNNTYLVQAYLSDSAPDSGMPGARINSFIVTPPLNRLEAHAKQAFRVLRIGGDFPTNRESLFYLTVNLIPSENAPEQEDKNSKIKFLSALAIKVFYRPEALNKAGAIREAAAKIKAVIRGDSLVLSNPTPYWITFRTLSVEGIALPGNSLAQMLPPFGQQVWTVPGGLKGSGAVSVAWRAITETGFDTDIMTANAVRLPSVTETKGNLREQ
ncbi:molecular chaperone [Enterobacter cloacae complex sp. ESBL7]|uniref:fimbrial biogenesis chaperone n=1 Tax=Enterobacter cloacae complex sp. ESBL7 TaxID=3163325 RepID=UPI0035685B81